LHFMSRILAADLMKAGNRRQFASDNYSGICPEAWKALEEANTGHARSYGDDIYTARAADLIREVFETNCEVFFAFNGTAANSLALATLCNSYHSILAQRLRMWKRMSAVRRSFSRMERKFCCCRARTERSIRKGSNGW
jgi:hypothetical protein